MNLKYWIAEAMLQRGGSFARALGNMIRHSDDDNWAKIKDTWPHIIANYMGAAEQMKREDDAKP